MPACVSDLTAAATDLKNEHPEQFGKSGALTQAFGLFVFAYSCGTFVGPTVSGVLKTKLSFGAATLIIACCCAIAIVPIVGFHVVTPLPDLLTMSPIVLPHRSQIKEEKREPFWRMTRKGGRTIIKSVWAEDCSYTARSSCRRL